MRSLFAVVAMMLCACGKGGDPSSGRAEGGSIKDITLTFPDNKNVDVGHFEASVVDKTGKPVTRFTDPTVVEVELRTSAGDDGELLCSGKNGRLTKDEEFDTKTGHIKLDDLGFFKNDAPSCMKDLLAKNYTGKVFMVVTMSIDYANLHATQELVGFKVPDGRPPLLPALDAEIEKLGKEIASIDPAAKLPPCTAELTGNQPLDAVDQVMFTDPPNGWVWLHTPLFHAMKQYKEREFDKTPEETLKRVQGEKRFLVYAAKRHDTPRLTPDNKFTPGIFDGHMMLFDRTKGKAVCAVPLVALSSESVGFTKQTGKRGNSVTYESDDSQHQVQKDFVWNTTRAIEKAMADAGLSAAKPRFPPQPGSDPAPPL